LDWRKAAKKNADRKGQQSAVLIPVTEIRVNRADLAALKIT